MSNQIDYAALDGLPLADAVRAAADWGAAHLELRDFPLFAEPAEFYPTYSSSSHVMGVPADEAALEAMAEPLPNLVFYCLAHAKAYADGLLTTDSLGEIETRLFRDAYMARDPALRAEQVKLYLKVWKRERFLDATLTEYREALRDEDGSAASMQGVRAYYRVEAGEDVEFDAAAIAGRPPVYASNAGHGYDDYAKLPWEAYARRKVKELAKLFAER